MRGITLDAFKRMNLASQSWEYASEMVVKSVHLGLRSEEVPVRFFKDQKGRLSHHARAGWFSPWQAGWINLKAMFIFGADFFLMIPGLVLLWFGLMLLLCLSAGPVKLNGVTLSLNAMMVGLFMSVVGLQMVLVGAIAQSLYDQTGRKRQRWTRMFTYNRTVVLAAGVFVFGLVLAGRFAEAFVESGYKVDASLGAINHQAVLGLFLMIGAILVFVAMLVIQAIQFCVPVAGRQRLS
jgi:hypothetical protein